jgi:hypothetical protein
MEADLRRQIIVEDQERPSGLRAPPERRVSIRREPERDVCRSLEIAMKLSAAPDGLDGLAE